MNPSRLPQRVVDSADFHSSVLEHTRRGGAKLVEGTLRAAECNNGVFPQRRLTVARQIDPRVVVRQLERRRRRRPLQYPM